MLYIVPRSNINLSRCYEKAFVLIYYYSAERPLEDIAITFDTLLGGGGAYC